jgi:phospholipase/carboxylesterase
MAPLSETPPVDLQGKSILIASGSNDPIISPQRAAQLALLLQQHRAVVEHRTLPTDDELSQADIVLSRKWLREYAAPTIRAS